MSGFICRVTACPLKGEEMMSEFLESIEKSVEYLRKRYAADLPLLLDLERKLDHLKSREGKSIRNMPLSGKGTD